jgi:hypothetical protein
VREEDGKAEKVKSFLRTVGSEYLTILPATVTNRLASFGSGRT